MRDPIQFHGIWLVLFLSVLVALPQSVWAAEEEDEFTLVTYEVGDLIIDIQDHPYGDSSQRKPSVTNSDRIGINSSRFQHLQLVQFGGGGGRGILPNSGNRNGGGNPASITMNDLVRVILATVGNQSWTEFGKGEGEIQPIGTVLVVWQKKSVQQQIGLLLDQLHRAIGDRKTVMIDARWLSLNSDDLDKLLAKDESGVPQIDRKSLENFTRRPTSIRGITNCFSGQLVYLVSGTRRNIVSGYIPVVGSLEQFGTGQHLVSLTGGASIQFIQDTYPVSGLVQQGVGYQPIVQTANFGALLELRPTVMRDKTAIVDLKATLTSSGGRSDESDVKEPFSLAPIVERNAIDTQELATTLRVPLDKPVLVGGLTHVPTAMRPAQQETTQGDQPVEESPQIYLILELR